MTTTNADMTEVRRLLAEWRSTRQTLDWDLDDSEQAHEAEQAAWDALIDYVEANDLNGTVYDPRGSGGEGDEY